MKQFIKNTAYIIKPIKYGFQVMTLDGKITTEFIESNDLRVRLGIKIQDHFSEALGMDRCYFENGKFMKISDNIYHFFLNESSYDKYCSTLKLDRGTLKEFKYLNQSTENGVFLYDLIEAKGSELTEKDLKPFKFDDKNDVKNILDAKDGNWYALKKK